MRTETVALPDYVDKYLSKYGLSGWSAALPDLKKYKNIIVVPAIQEFQNIKTLLASLQNNDRKYFGSTLVLFVINNLKSSPSEVKDDNRKSIEFLWTLRNGKNGEIDEFSKTPGGAELNIGYVDASSPGLEMPENDGGVGLARKIGMDLALRKFDYASRQKNILICLDADCTVDNNYITQIVDSFNEMEYSAACVSFEHQIPESQEHKSAIIAYEIFLRYYVLGLKYADSLFAIHSIGSTMVCDAENYIKVGGMNKKKAAEDFYFLEKLSKICRVNEIKSTKVYPSPRPSWRVPFGTGQRVNRYFSKSHNEYELYDPRCFEILKSWLSIFNDESPHTAEEYLESAEKIHPALIEFLEINSFKDSWNKVLRNSSSAVQIQKQKHFWFDGFRTLKFIHYLRDSYFQPLNMFEALDGMFEKYNIPPEKKDKASIPPLETQMLYLEKLRNLA